MIAQAKRSRIMQGGTELLFRYALLEDTAALPTVRRSGTYIELPVYPYPPCTSSQNDPFSSNHSVDIHHTCK